MNEKTQGIKDKPAQGVLRAGDVFPPYNKPSGIKDFDSAQEESFVPTKQKIPEFDLKKELFISQRQLTSQRRTGPGKSQTIIAEKTAQPSVEEFLEAVMPQSDTTPPTQTIKIKPIEEIQEQVIIKPTQAPVVAITSSDKISTQVKNLLTRNEEAVIMDIVSRDIANFLRQGAA